MWRKPLPHKDFQRASIFDECFTTRPVWVVTCPWHMDSSPIAAGIRGDLAHVEPLQGTVN